MQISCLRNAYLSDGVPKLAKLLRLARSKKGKIRLVICVDAGHQFDVWPVVLGKMAVPGIAELMVAPGPLLLPRSDVMVGDMDHPCLRGVVVPAKEIVIGAEDHVAGWNRDVRVPTQVICRVGTVGSIEARLLI